jgi:hypothetical protein
VLLNAFKWISIWFFLAAIIVLLVGLFNYIIDPYGFNQKILIPNVNIIKDDNTRFPIKNKIPFVRAGGWDNLLLGTSKIGVMNTQPVNKLLGGRTFNLSLPASSIPEQYDAFMYAIKFNHIKNVVYGIDFLSLNKNLKLSSDYIQFKEKLRSFDRIYNYDIYLNIDTLKTSFKDILNNRSADPKLHNYYSKTGVRHYDKFIQLSQKPNFDMERRIHELLQEFFRDWVYADYEFSFEYMDLFKKIVDYCHAHDINLYVYIPPMYVEHFYAIKEAGLKDEFNTFKKELAKVTNFIDFTGVNSVTKNPDLFWDSTHLRIEATSIVMNKVIKNRDTKGYEDFGVMVTKNNIEEHLKKQDLEYQKINLKKIFDENLEDVITF